MAINNGKTKESLPIDLLKENLRYDDIINKKKKNTIGAQRAQCQDNETINKIKRSKVL